MKNNLRTIAVLGILTSILTACAVGPEGVISRPGIYYSTQGGERMTAYVFQVDEPFRESMFLAIPYSSSNECNTYRDKHVYLRVCHNGRVDSDNPSQP